MKRNFILTLGFLISFIFSKAQNWESIGRFNRAPDVFWFDSLSQKCFVAGTYTWFDSTEIHGCGYISGDTVISLGCGFYSDCITPLNYLTSTVPKVQGFASFLGEIYVTGYFKYAGNTEVNGIAKWNGNDWGPNGSGLSITGATGSGIGYGIKVMQGDLYLYGLFDSVNGVPAKSIAKFDGNDWTSVFDVPRFEPNNPNKFFDAEWFLGELYVGGNFSMAGTNPPIRDIVKWDGANWVAVEIGFTGTFTGVNKLIKYKNKLVIAGHFNYVQSPGSIPGNGISMWDGVDWDTLQGGVWYLQSAGVVYDVKILNDDIYVFGGFDQAGEIPAKNIAKWDGTKWCAVSDYIQYSITNGAFYNDTLFITYGSGVINGDTNLIHCAKWVGGVFGDTCGPLVYVPKPTSSSTFTLFPNPTTTSFEILIPENLNCSKIKILDIRGAILKELSNYKLGSPPIEIPNLPAGIYIVEVSGDYYFQALKLVVQ